MQTFGLGAIMLLLPVAIWGWRMLTHRHFDREALRIAFWILAAVTCAGFASCWPRTGTWPLPTGLGGVTGDALLRLPASLIGADGFFTRLLLGTLFGAATVVTFAIASGAGSREKPAVEDFEDDADEDEGAVERESRILMSLGLISHAVLSFRARIGRFFSGAYSWLVSGRAAPRAVQLDRREPSLHGSGPSIVPQSVDDEEEEEEEDEEEEESVARAPRKRAPRALAKKPSSSFVLPPISVLTAPKASDRKTLSQDVLQQNAKLLEAVLQDFGVRGEITNARPGPVVTLYELEPAPGIKSSRVIGLADDIARSMSAMAARVAVVAGRNAIGIELPNEYREKVYLRELLSAKENIEIGREAAAVSRQDHRRQVGHHRSGAHAAHADRRHHRLRQIGRHQHHDPQPALPAAARSVPADHGRSEDARAVGL